MEDGLTYKDAGVDIEEGERLVDAIKPLAASTFRDGVLSKIGHFGALFEVDTSKYKKPVLVSSTDGVGTKLKIASMMGRHDTVGIDLVAMCVNDILTLGAEPLFFLDYFATGKLRRNVAVEVIKGITEGCKQAGCALIGGETAEMPGFYKEGEYELSGFVVGIVEKDEIVSGRDVKEGDGIVGIASSGLHSNGYSLIRKLFFEMNNYKIDTYIQELGRPLGEELLEPTMIYVKGIKRVLNSGIPIKAMAHITGGGMPGNLPRAIPEGFRVVIKQGSWPEHPIFKVIQRLGNISVEEMRRTFNLGIGYVLVVDETDAERTLELLEGEGYKGFIIGRVEKGEGGVIYE
jgi:phosphoribosylformylglycinamidine cyclo-ligase